MQFKRWRLSNAHPFVNAGLGLALLFGIAACSGKTADTPEETAEVPEMGTSLELPAVWSTRPLGGEIASIALSDGVSGLLAVAYAEGGLELFNMEAEPLGEKSNSRVQKISQGFSSEIDGALITVFPGINRDGALKGYIYGEGLIAPAEIDLPIEEERAVAGLCSAAPMGDGLFRLGYWTMANNRVIKTGMIRAVEGELEWSPGESATFDYAVTGCSVASGGPEAFNVMTDIEPMTRPDFDAEVRLREDGQLSIVAGDRKFAPVALRDGITVVAPDAPVAMAAMGRPLSGGYPGGLIVVAGETSDGDHQAVFVDPSALTLAER